jgi:hypothetical protein
VAYLKSKRESGRLRFYDFSDTDIAGVDFGNTSAGLLHGAGASSTPVATSTADKKFMSYYSQCTATSGDSRGLYLRHELDGTIAATGYGDAIRAWAKVGGTGYSYACGVHATMSVDASATVTGSGAGLRATLGAAAESRTLSGALAAVQADSDIGANNTMPTIHGFIRFTNSGSVSLSNLLVLPSAPVNGSIFAAHVTDAMTHSIRVIDSAGTAYYLMATTTVSNRS